MVKDKTINIRITSKEHANVKKYGGVFTKIWNMGYDVWIRKIPELLIERSEEYRLSYTQCKDDLKKSRDNVNTIDSELDILCKTYINNGRSIDAPTAWDNSWINSRIKKLDGISKKVFLERCKLLKGGFKNND